MLVEFGHLRLELRLRFSEHRRAFAFDVQVLLSVPACDVAVLNLLLESDLVSFEVLYPVARLFVPQTDLLDFLVGQVQSLRALLLHGHSLFEFSLQFVHLLVVLRRELFQLNGHLFGRQ